MIQQDERLLRQLGKMQRPIPGSSLTANTDNQAAFEGPPEFTSKKEAIEQIFADMMREENYVPMMEALGRGTTVMEITQVLLMEGFRQGKWNPDLFLMLIEPTSYMAMALAERAGIDFDIDREQDEEEADRQQMTILDEKLKRTKSKLKKSAPKGVLPASVEKQIEEGPMPESLLARAKPEPEIEESDSLLNNPAEVV